MFRKITEQFYKSWKFYFPIIQGLMDILQKWV